MAWTIIDILIVASAVLMVLESRGVRTTLQLHFKGDVKRETRWLAQYGQSLCTAVIILLMWQLDPGRDGWLRSRWFGVVAAFGIAMAVATVVKRILGRVRPNRENAGKFLGFTWKHANYRESFPSSHSACAVAVSAMLAHVYPPAAITFWALGIGCAVLRYVLDAHWPSDVLAGIALGGASANVAVILLGIR